MTALCYLAPLSVSKSLTLMYPVRHSLSRKARWAASGLCVIGCIARLAHMTKAGLNINRHLRCSNSSRSLPGGAFRGVNGLFLRGLSLGRNKGFQLIEVGVEAAGIMGAQSPIFLGTELQHLTMEVRRESIQESTNTIERGKRTLFDQSRRNSRSAGNI